MMIAAKRISDGSWRVIEGTTYVRNEQKMADIRLFLKHDVSPSLVEELEPGEGRTVEGYVSKELGLAYGPKYLIESWLEDREDSTRTGHIMPSKADKIREGLDKMSKEELVQLVKNI